MKKTVSNNLFLLRYVLKYCPKYVVLIFVHSIMASTMIIVNIVFQRLLLNSLGTGRPWEYYIVVIVGLWLLNMLSSAFSSWLHQVFVPANSQKLSEKMQELVYEKALLVEYACFEDANFYDLYTQAIQQADRRANGVIETLSSFVGCVFSFGALLSLLGILDPLLIAINLLFAAIAFAFNKRTYALQHQQYKERVPPMRSLLYAGRIFSMREYAKELRVYHDFPKIVLNKFRTASDRLIELSKTHGKKVALLSFLQAITGGTSTSGIMLYLAHRVISGNLLMGDFVALSSASQQMGNSITELLMVFPRLYEHSIYIDAVRDFLAYDPIVVDVISPQEIPETVNLNICNLSFTYPMTEKAALNNICMEIRHGEKVAFVGQNGAGKSTLTKLLVRLYDPSEGAILINGIDYKQYKIESLRSTTGILLQDYQIYATTIAENILMRPIICEADERLITEALEFSGLYNKVSNFHEGIYTIVQREFSNDGAIFSGGELQKLALARVYAKKPSIIILDEPSSALDPYAEFELFQTMLRLMENKTVILTSHRLANIRDADRIYYIENGEITEFGSHEELMALQGRYCEMFALQADQYKDESHAQATAP